MIEEYFVSEHLMSYWKRGQMNTQQFLSDQDYMRRAIALARKGEGWCHPNPMVGAVIVKDGRVIGEGYHARCGELHAERNAFASLTEPAAGATIYVTLEPCCHYGRTPPCTEAIIEHQISRVVIGSRDPNPKVSGGGARVLREAGITVEEDFLREECDALNPVFFHYITSKTPYVIMKYAMTADGKIATKTGVSKWITGEKARTRVHELRHACMGIMAGIGTVLADDPMLNCRIPNGRDPVRIICDSRLQIPLESNLCRTAGEIPLIVACAFPGLPVGPVETAKNLMQKGRSDSPWNVPEQTHGSDSPRNTPEQTHGSGNPRNAPLQTPGSDNPRNAPLQTPGSDSPRNAPGEMSGQAALENQPGEQVIEKIQKLQELGVQILNVPAKSGHSEQVDDFSQSHQNQQIQSEQQNLGNQMIHSDQQILENQQNRQERQDPQNQKNARVDLRLLAQLLGQMEIDSILLEGGGTLNESALRAGIVHEVRAFIAPKIFGGSAKSPVEGTGVAFPDESVRLSMKNVEQIGKDLLVTWLCNAGWDCGSTKSGAISK